uniref:Cep57 centrosome microtubule-binding domain-containing protein n=1 Tax=Sphaeramia orbicularis TaxID=375764 RepID=A0A672YXR0_9TELE
MYLPQSTSPSHSVHANVQSILHMMKHHQPQLCERVSALHRSGCTAKKSLQKDFCPSSIAFQKPHSEEEEEQSVGSLSDLLLALQDELGQMSFEHQELVRQIDETDDRGQRQDLQNELERVVMRMEEKGAQITKLRKHQQMVCEKFTVVKILAQSLASFCSIIKKLYSYLEFCTVLYMPVQVENVSTWTKHFHNGVL